jgi:hypothetical protein
MTLASAPLNVKPLNVLNQDQLLYQGAAERWPSFFGMMDGGWLMADGGWQMMDDG